MEGDARRLRVEGWSAYRFTQWLRKISFRKETLESLTLPLKGAPHERVAGICRRMLPTGTDESLAFRLWVLGDAVSGDELFSSMGELLGELIEIGLLEAGSGEVRSTVMLLPVGSGWIASDFPRELKHGRDDFTMGVGPSSRQLAAMVGNCAGKKVLEIGCGGGWLGTQLRRCGVDYTGVDLNERALNLAAFNFRLAGLESADLRHGDLYEPVRGERYDRIFANPPYVQSPGGHLIYRESEDPQKGSVCERLVRGWADFLNPGGIAVSLLNWCHRVEDEWRDLPLSWVDGSGLRAWLFRTELSSAAEYAWRWIDHDPRFEIKEEAEKEFDRWMAYYRSREISWISGGVMVVQAPEAQRPLSWVRCESRALAMMPDLSWKDVEQVLENQTLMEVLDGGPDWLGRGFRVVDGVSAELLMKLESGWTRQMIRLKSPGLVGYDGEVDENLLRLLEILRNGGSANDMVAEIRAKPELAGVEGLQEMLADLVRELFRSGVLRWEPS